MTTIASQVRALQDLTPAQLAARYQELLGKPPRSMNKAYLRRQVAWHLQAREFGGLSDTAQSRLDSLIAQIDQPLGQPAPKQQRAPRAEARAPLIGSTLVRQWHGQDVCVHVRENGFEWNGSLFASLTAVARAITGSAWNGRLFFGLTKRSSTS